MSFAAMASIPPGSDVPSSTPPSWRQSFGESLRAFQRVEREFDERREAPYTYELVTDPASGNVTPVLVSQRAGGFPVAPAVLLGGGLLLALVLLR